MKIKTDSKTVTTNDTFVAIKGCKFDGHNYIDEAIHNGADLIISEKNIIGVNNLVVSDTKKFLNNYIYNLYYSYIDNMTFIGITGTNGKTTTAFLIYELLKNMGVKVSYIGTLGFYIDNKVKDLLNTTPDIVTLYDLLLTSLKEKVEVVVMEVSSHALSENRVYGIRFDYAVFTNLTQDHLDYHKTMENYLNSKKKLFKMTKEKYKRIINIDSKYSNEFIDNNTITYGFNNSDFKVVKSILSIDSTKYVFNYNNKNYKVKINIPGRYNIYNSIIGIIILNDMGFSIKKIIKLLKKIEVPKGRMQILKYKKGYAIVDYAHTPDAVFNVLSSAKEYKKGNIITIIGCGGNRDKTKRSEMALISILNSNYVIFTNDNPRDENEDDIINDMVCNLKENNYEIILDRRKAIEKGLSMIKDNDILFILGKGHESYQIINGIKYHFDDYEEVLKNI